MDQKYITIQGARENNLKNISLKIPKDKLIIINIPHNECLKKGKFT